MFRRTVTRKLFAVMSAFTRLGKISSPAMIAIGEVELGNILRLIFRKERMGEAGRPTDLTEELFREIKQAVFAGCNYQKIAEACSIPVSTFYTWHSDNYLSLADKIEGWRRDSKLQKADRNIDEILDLPREDKDFVKVVADMSKFVKETLDKPNYSKRSELGGIDNKDLPAPILGYVLSDNSNEKDS